MPNGGLDGVENQLLEHNSEDPETNLMMKGQLLIIHKLKSLPCTAHKNLIEENTKARWKLLGISLTATVILIPAALIVWKLWVSKLFE